MSPLRIWTTTGLLTIWAANALAQPAPTLAPFSGATGGKPPAPWRVVGLPGAAKPFTAFDITMIDGRAVLRVRADRSYANLVHDLNDVVLAPDTQLRWRWRLDQPLADADLRRRETDDSALKLCLLFNPPLESLSAVERGQLAVARLISGEKLPAATLCYVWDPTLPTGTLLPNAHSARLRWIVARGEGAALGTWQDETHDLHTDFLRAFGDETRAVPPLKAIALGADADNTGGRSAGWVVAPGLQP